VAIGTEFLVRLPRRTIAVELLINEQRWLPVLAPRLPIRIPVPIRVGAASSHYPWPWSIVHWVDGEPSDSAVFDQTTVGAQLGAFLRSLHTEAPADAPFNEWRGVPLRDRNDAFEERVARLGRLIDATRVRGLWVRALHAPSHSDGPTWIHGDLHPDNVIIDGGKVSAVLDFGDLCAGDPATDLASAWLQLDEDGRETLFSVYGNVDRSLRVRAAGWATLFALMLLELGVAGRVSYEAIAVETLNRLTGQASPDRVDGTAQ
jgi:aminoglycoside phosphotransferase (APT) family kinase protein